jgi:hypothetical protein
MGACDFNCYAEGRSPREAFNNAVQQARYDYGHSGYTGTIAEKESFVLIEDTSEDVIKLARDELALPQDERCLNDNDLKDIIFNLADNPGDKEVIIKALRDLDDERIADKWGPAGCIKDENGKGYFFFGWASS